MFLHLCVILFTGGSLSWGVSVWGVSVWGVSVWGVSVWGVSVWGSLSGGSLSGGSVGSLSMGSLSRNVGLHDRDPPYGNVRVVRILLECILGFTNYKSFRWEGYP